MSLAENRIAVGALLGGVLFFAGAVGGLFYGGAVVPKGSGLAGPAIVLGWGVAFGAVAAVIGIALAATLPIARLRTAARISVVAGVLALIAIVGRIVWVQVNRATEAGQAAAPVPQSKPVPTAPVDQP